MPGSIIRNYLLLDTLDTTASAINTLNGNGWGSASSVPYYMYTSLCTIWTGASGSVDAFEKAIVATSSEGKMPNQNAITISPYICESADYSSNNEGPALSDGVGAENAIVKILFKTTATPTRNFDRAQNAELRVRLLLDAKLRAESGKSSSIPIDNSNDLSIDETYNTFLCSWLGYEVEPAASQMVSIYAVTYYRSFGAAIIP